MSANILSPEERQALLTIPDQIGDEDLVRFFTLSPEYLAAVDQRVKPSHRLAQAAHICLLHWLGWSPTSIDQLPRLALAALCEQLQIPIPAEGLELLPERTNRRHARKAREYLGWRQYASAEEESLGQWLKELAAEHDHSRRLLNALLQRLYQERIVRPGLTTLERLVEKVRAAAKAEIAQVVDAQLTAGQKERLDELITIPEGEFWPPLQWLKETPRRFSGRALLTVLEQIALIRAIEVDRLNLGEIHPNRIKLLAQRARRRRNWATGRLQPEERYPLLVCFLAETLPNLIDLAVSIHNEAIRRIFRRARQKRDDEVAQRGQRLNEKILLLGYLLRLVLDEEGIADDELRATIYRQTSRETLADTIRECGELALPADYAPFSFAQRSYSYLRSFGPRFLEQIPLQSPDEDHHLLEAVAFMQEVNSKGSPFEQPPGQFIPYRWKSYVKDAAGEVNRPMYELCLHDCLVKSIERGELWARDSQTYTSLRRDWISDEDWPRARRKFLGHFPHLVEVEAFLQQARANLDRQMERANQAWPSLQDQVRIEEGQVRLSRLEPQELPPHTAKVQQQLTHLFPRIGIAQLLLEVNHWVGVDELLTNLYARERPAEELTVKKMAVLLAEGLNIGLQNMSYCVPSLSYSDLAGVYERYFYEETLQKAITAVVNFYQRLPITRLWGDGTSSSSDGQLFGVAVQTVHSQYHPKAPGKSGRAVSLYTHVSDHAIPFYSQVIHHLGQEGAYVLDGLLYHETELEPRRHFVDTGGYQDTLWGACHLLGFSLEPRIRDINEMRLFRLRRRVDRYEHIHPLFAAPINTRAIRENWDDLLRLLASIYTGVVPAARVLRKLNAYHVESGLYKALREVGRIAKTAFLLRYFTERKLRQEVQAGLNLQESLHALIRALFVGQRGEFRQRDLALQVARASCLQLVAAMVITWNAAYLSAALDRLREEGSRVGEEQMAHILPLTWGHINLLGRYEFNAAAPSVQTDLSALPLRSTDEILEQLGLGI